MRFISRNRLYSGFFLLWIGIAFLLSLSSNSLYAEGSADFRNYAGYRLFLWVEKPQQFKVFARAGEFINVGSSHVGVSGGSIRVFDPSGNLAATFDDSGTLAGKAIIRNDIEEINGPTGGGTAMGNGYQPGIVPVGEEGIWTVTFEYPSYESVAFPNLSNNQPWNRASDQPLIRRVVLAWDITVSKDAAGNETGSTLLKGRVYSNEYNSIVNQNGNTTSPSYYVLTRDGYRYRVDFNNTDPWGFPLVSNSLGIVDNRQQPVYKSLGMGDYIRSATTAAWQPGSLYYYEPQAQDAGPLINNKIFFNPPDTSMPAVAQVTDIFRNNTHQTWLNRTVPNQELVLNNFTFMSAVPGGVCGANVTLTGAGGYIVFNSGLDGAARLSLDLNNDGDFDDAVDRLITQSIVAGTDSIFWDGKDGRGQVVPANPAFRFTYKLELKGGEVHILLFDVENNKGGITFTRLNGPDAPGNDYYFDHSGVGGSVSGSGTPGKPQATTQPDTYTGGFGNDKLLDYWSYITYASKGIGTFNIAIVDDCGKKPIDSDGDGIADRDDLDDDNDGITDKDEFCNANGGGFACLPGGQDPGKDNDNDGIPNYLDANDPSVPNDCPDANADGKCDRLNAAYDTDFDGVPDHLDLDSDNDGITDLVEAAHRQPDANGDGVIDGSPAAFGLNGLFDPIDSDPASLNANATYSLKDKDADKVPDCDDLDSDNDGINDVAEAGFPLSDTNNDGRIDDGNGNVPKVNANGLVPTLDPANTGKPIPLPQDADNDGIPDWHDLDSDNDGINDVIEGGNPDPDNNGITGLGKPVVGPDGRTRNDSTGKPLATTSRPPDKDLDGVPDWHDLDSDNDGINDVTEGGSPDPDNDGVIATGKPTVNPDGQAAGATSNPQDKDLDGIPDWHDLDSDNDGINDVTEGGNPDPDNDGIIGKGRPVVNPAGMATADAAGQPLATTSKPADTDKDGIPDWHDLDSDNDGINDVTEGGNPDPDNDGVTGNGKPTVNPDGQPSGATSKPVDTDKDGQPDFRDLDSDNDGIKDAIEGGNPDPDNDGIVGTGKPTVNPDGQPKGAASNPTDSDNDGEPDFRDLDSDNDGLPDADECTLSSNCRDLDGDGLPDYRDKDRDGDGIVDGYECTAKPCEDTDGDGISDVDDLDSDDDGLPDAYECPKGAICPDSDGDGIPDFRDTDSDNDGKHDREECPAGAPCADYDGDGQPNYIDRTCDLLMTRPEVTTNSPLCTGDTLVMNAQFTLPPAIQAAPNAKVEFVWRNGNGDTISTSGPMLRISSKSPKAIPPYTVMYAAACCVSEYSLPVDVVVHPVPKAIATSTAGPTGICQGESVQLIAGDFSGATYEWRLKGSSVLVSTEQKPVINGLLSTATYELKVKANGCPADSAATTTVVVNPVPEVGGLTGAGTYCEGEPLALSGSNTIPTGGITTFVWSGPAGFNYTGKGSGAGPYAVRIPAVGLQGAGTYSLQLISDKGCKSVPQSVIIVVNPRPTPPVLGSADNTICEGELLELNSTAATGKNVVYSWWFQATLQDTLRLLEQTRVPDLFLEKVHSGAAGYYSVTVMVDGCLSVSSNLKYISVNPRPDAQTDHFSLAFNTKLEGANLLLNDSLRRLSEWQVTIIDQPEHGKLTQTDGIITYQPRLYFFGTDQAVYRICSKACPNVCDTAAIVFDVEIPGVDACKISNVLTPNGDNQNDVLIIPCAGDNPDNELVVFNRWGGKVYRAAPYGNDWGGTYNGDLLPAGTYFYIFKKDKRQQTGRQGFVTIIRD